MKKRLLLLFSIFLLTVSVPLEAFAYNLFGYRLTNGVGNWGKNRQYYYIHDSAKKYYKSLINRAWETWIHSPHILSTPISFRETTNKKSAVVELSEFYDITSEHDYLGITYFYKYQQEVYPWDTNWGWAKINLNRARLKNLRETDQQGTIAHELGHAMGLAHNMYEFSVMCQFGAGRKTARPLRDDYEGINKLY
ncbi:matrixin family metalloprotease [Thermoactinomyces sp. DSM 45892]|uniref:matrixin family metalloprotease n=1 Tax=Thermoactinomyces sp. DSM 45892 TaxID=1882753 RepID=UPI000898B554|nr:matrixin family metalloprotease [Thermoactinomyces sp. DSM 45892]SDY35925.1 Matrixin [Thermoactinomyces sp. DSM 45892]